MVAEDMWWVAGLTENKTKPSSWGLAELGNKLSRVGVVAEDMWWVVAEDMWCGCRGYVVGGWIN